VRAGVNVSGSYNAAYGDNAGGGVTGSDDVAIGRNAGSQPYHRCWRQCAGHGERSGGDWPSIGCDRCQHRVGRQAAVAAVTSGTSSAT